MPIYRLGPVEYGFPPASAALDEPNGLLAVGGDLSPERLLDAYRHGIFPWFNDGDPVCWWSPDPRAVLPLDGLRVTRSLRRSLRRYEVRFDTDFAGVVEACADPGRPGRWITPELVGPFKGAPGSEGW